MARSAPKRLPGLSAIIELPVATERLILRRMAAGDLHDLLAYQTHPANCNYQTVTPFTEQKAIEYLEKQAAFDPFGDAGGWMAIGVELKAEARLIGEVGIFLPPAPRSHGDVGWSLHPDYHGRGYATEAARALFAYAFTALQLHRVTSGCDARNIPSLRLMERIGMRREAHFRESAFADGAWQDSIAYGLLRDEWEAQQTTKKIP